MIASLKPAVLKMLNFKCNTLWNNRKTHFMGKCDIQNSKLGVKENDTDF